VAFWIVSKWWLRNKWLLIDSTKNDRRCWSWSILLVSLRCDGTGRLAALTTREALVIHDKYVLSITTCDIKRHFWDFLHEDGFWTLNALDVVLCCSFNVQTWNVGPSSFSLRSWYIIVWCTRLINFFYWWTWWWRWIIKHISRDSCTILLLRSKFEVSTLETLAGCYIDVTCNCSNTFIITTLIRNEWISNVFLLIIRSIYHGWTFISFHLEFWDVVGFLYLFSLRNIPKRCRWWS